ncbi:MAG: hypothetical protein J6Q79_07145 [Clostridia bacterium]|nr:hypothetical protein [Clostridia bacterium]
MNSFNVKTPDDWKEKLFAKTTDKKTVRIKPVTLIAAVLAVIICISGSAFAVRVSKAPEYFGSVFLGDSPVVNEVYSEKDYYFDSSRDDLTLRCKGIAGDSYSVYILFELKSEGDILFDENKSYYIANRDQSIPFVSSLGSSWNTDVIDERTLSIDISYSSYNGLGLAGKTISMYFKDLETFDHTKVIDCEFSGEIVVDYRNSIRKLIPTEGTLNLLGVEFKPTKGKISNFHFDYTLDVVDGKEIYSQIDDHEFVTGTLTLNYDDGAKDSFTLRLPPQNSEEASAALTGKHEKDLRIVIGLPKPISAANVISVELDGVELFSVQ